MNDIEQKVAFYAKLANINDLKDLSRPEKEQLMVDAVKAGLFSSVFFAAKIIRKDKRFMESWDDPNNIPGPWGHIWDVHPWARKLIGNIVDDGKADVREFEKVMIGRRPEVWILDKNTGRVVAPSLPDTDIFAALENAIKTDPFPFSRCSMCNKIFVPNKNQKYCGKSCATKALTPWKKNYMKDYMNERRHPEKKRRVKK